MSDDTEVATRDWREQCLSLLDAIYKPEGVHVWLTSRHRQFGGLTVYEMEQAGRHQEVLDVLVGLAGGPLDDGSSGGTP